MAGEDVIINNPDSNDTTTYSHSITLDDPQQLFHFVKSGVENLIDFITEEISEITSAVGMQPVSVTLQGSNIRFNIPLRYGVIFAKDELVDEVKDELERNTDKDPLSDNTVSLSYNDIDEIATMIAHERGVYFLPLSSDSDLLIAVQVQKAAQDFEDNDNGLSAQDIKLRAYVSEIFSRVILAKYEQVLNVSRKGVIIIGKNSINHVISRVQEVLDIRNTGLSEKDIIDYLFYEKDIDIEEIPGYNLFAITSFGNSVIDESIDAQAV